MIELKNDKYKRNREGYSRVLELSCAHCGTLVCYYQKDGPGIIKRFYADRIHPQLTKREKIVCNKCKSLIAVLTNYKKENRPAYSVLVGAIKKKTTQSKNI